MRITDKSVRKFYVSQQYNISHLFFCRFLTLVSLLMYTYLLSGVDLLTARCSCDKLIMQHTLLLLAVSSWLLVNVEAAQGGEYVMSV